MSFFASFFSWIFDHALSGVVFFVILSIIILIHEAGHFWAARFGGIKVEEFGLGLPPRAIGKRHKKSGVLFSLNWIPFGGFVKMLDENGNEHSKSPEAFCNRPLWARLFTTVAGVLMNFVFAFVLLTAGYFVGIHPIITDRSDFDRAVERGYIEQDKSGAFITDLVPGGSAAKAGIAPDSFIQKINAHEVSGAEDLILYLHTTPTPAEGHRILIVEKKFTPGQEPVSVRSYWTILRPDDNNRIGVYLSDPPVISVSKEKHGLFGAMGESLRVMGKLSVVSTKALGNFINRLVVRQEIPEDIGGPIRTADMVHTLVKWGTVEDIFIMTALLSFSIGLLNIMPIPALDGGRLVFLLLEGIFRRPIPRKIEAPLHGLFLLLLLFLLLIISGNDIRLIFFAPK